MLTFFHQTLLTLYLALPPLCLIGALHRRRVERSPVPMRNFMGAFALGAIIAAAFCAAYALSLGGRPLPRSVLLTVYLATGMLLLLRGFDRIVTYALAVLTRPLHAGAFRGSLRATARLIILAIVIIPFVASVAFTYRPGVVIDDSKRLQQSDISPVPVTFASTDGLKLAAWWIPASHPSSNTILLVHGVGAGKSDMIAMARMFTASGFNVFAPDLRSFGGSAGRVSSFGCLERRDVAGAVRYLQLNYPGQLGKLYALGVGPGAAAILAAATTTPEGRSIDAIAVFDCYADLPSLSRDVSTDRLLPPFDWLIGRAAVSFASLQSGADLNAFRPEDFARDLWPRPLLVVQAEYARLVPYDQGQLLYHEASLPKTFVQYPGTERKLLRDPTVVLQVIDFFSTARPLPYI